MDRTLVYDVLVDADPQYSALVLLVAVAVVGFGLPTVLAWRYTSAASAYRRYRAPTLGVIAVLALVVIGATIRNLGSDRRLLDDQNYATATGTVGTARRDQVSVGGKTFFVSCAPGEGCPKILPGQTADIAYAPINEQGYEGRALRIWTVAPPSPPASPPKKPPSVFVVRPIPGRVGQ